ncbi:MAG: UTP--glucose-1-phosphate uridylyltransferase, partial [Bacteroidota bacterium]
MNVLIETITSTQPRLRNRSFFELCRGKSANTLLEELRELENFRKSTDSLYHRVRACLFMHGAYRYFLQQHKDLPTTGNIPFGGFEHLLSRRFEEAISSFQLSLNEQGPSGSLMSALAEAYHQRSFQILADQVRRSVRSSVGNQWMFRGGHSTQHPIRIHPRLLQREEGSVLFPILEEKTAVRMDLTHSGWSDIFFLGMDYPEAARVLNVSINLGVYGRDKSIRPPIQTYVRVITEPLIRLTSVDLGATKDITDLDDLFNFGNDYLGLVKAGVIASGTITPAFEGTRQSLAEILGRIVAPGMGLEVVTMVNDIPKGSRFAVSTNLLGSIISALMRATQQTQNLEGKLLEHERRLVASRAILGEWIGGSGGGWQDSGGVWPGVKAIEGAVASEGDPEFGISRGCLLPQHRVLEKGVDLHEAFAERLTSSLVLMHGGMAQNVGPILEMVTEKYLYRSGEEWKARKATAKIYKGILDALREGDIPQLAKLTTKNWEYPIKTIIPWASTHFTEVIIQKAKERFKKDYLGF